MTITRTHASVIAFTFAAMFAGQAMAASSDTPITRQQVKAELAEAIRTGNIVPGESGLRLNELYPHAYPQNQNTSTVTRAQVQAELDEAVRTGNVVVGESSRRLNEIYPQNYVAQNNASGKSREQVRAELAEAIDAGLLDRKIPA